jgi:hypothetical protein
MEESDEKVTQRTSESWATARLIECKQNSNLRENAEHVNRV